MFPPIKFALRRNSLLSIAAAMLLVVIGRQVDAADLEYHRDIEPILRVYCGGCHNDTEKDGDFSLVTYSSMMSGTPDGPVIVPGAPDQSLMLQVILGHREPKMPPEDEPQLKPEDVEKLRLWIEQGAVRGQTLPPAADRGMNAATKTSASSALSYVGAACSIPSDRLAVGGYQQVTLLDSAGQTVWVCRDIPGKVNQLRLSPDAHWLLASSGQAGASGEVVLIHVDDGTVGKIFNGTEDLQHSDLVYCAALSPDGRWLASGSYDRKVIIWDVATGLPIRALSGHNGTIYDLDFDPTGQALATASGDQTVKLWKVESGERLDTFGQPEGEMLSVRFSHSGQYVYAAGADRQIRQWRIVTLAQPAINPMTATRFAHDSDVVQLQLLDDDRLISASSDKTIKLWSLPALDPLGALGSSQDIPVAICFEHARQTASVVDLFGNVMPLKLPELGSLELEGSKPSAVDGKVVEGMHPMASTAPLEVDNLEALEPNDKIHQALAIRLPAEIKGSISPSTEGEVDVDLFRFQANQGQPWIFEVNAARSGSLLDSRLEILHADGTPVVRTRLQAVRESYFTFRGKDSTTIDDFRLHKWEDMELDEYLYSSGEVVRLWLYPRGPDSGFKVYPGAGNRYTFFDTTPTAHALGESAYIVRELPPGIDPLANGLPVFPIYFENDDDPLRRQGADSRLQFVAPETAEYVLRIRDARGFGSDKHTYQLTARSPQPDFQIAVNGAKHEIPILTGKEWNVSVTRLDGMDAPIVVELDGLPPGIEATNPLIVEANQISAVGTLFATTAAESLLTKAEGEVANASSETYTIRLRATAEIGDKTIVHELPTSIELTIKPRGGFNVRVVDIHDSAKELDELVIHPDQTVSARVVLERNGNEEAISFGNEDSGRGLPHGAFVDNIGLNGLLIPSGLTEREFFITAAPKVPPGRYQFHLRSTNGGNPTTRPIWLRVEP